MHTFCSVYKQHLATFCSKITLQVSYVPILFATLRFYKVVGGEHLSVSSVNLLFIVSACQLALHTFNEDVNIKY